MRFSIWILLGASVAGHGAEKKSTASIPFTVSHERSTFSGNLDVTTEGELKKTKVSFVGAIRNEGKEKIGSVTFCVTAYDVAEKQLGVGCLLELSGRDWMPGTALPYRGEIKNIRLDDSKSPAVIASARITVTELNYLADNEREIKSECSSVWSAAMRVFSEARFHPTVSDAQSHTASFAFDGGMSTGPSADSDAALYTTVKAGLLGGNFQGFRIESASLFLRENDAHACVANVKLAFAGYARPILAREGWVVLPSNFTFERRILDQIDATVNQEMNRRLDVAIERLPKNGSDIVAPTTKPAIVSVAANAEGADIIVDGKFVGNTPSKLSLPPGEHRLLVEKQGYVAWSRTITVAEGSEINVAVHLMLNEGDGR